MEITCVSQCDTIFENHRCKILNVEFLKNVTIDVNNIELTEIGMMESKERLWRSYLFLVVQIHDIGSLVMMQEMFVFLSTTANFVV